MRTKALYIIVSDGSSNNYILEQAYLSIFSLKKYNEDMSVSVLVDSDTEKIITKHFIGNIIDDIISVQLDDIKSTIHRSRFLKTTARKYVKGDLICIDTDTVVVGTLKELDDFDFDMGAVLDYHAFFEDYCVPSYVRENLSKIDKKYKNVCIDKYFNSGVVYMKDVKSVHDFYNIWHSYWKQGALNKMYFDQPSFLLADIKLNLITELSGIWNCQISFNGLSFFYESKIIHYFNSFIRSSLNVNGSPYYFADKDIYIKINKEKAVPLDLQDKLKYPKTLFVSPVEIIAGDSVSIIHSKQFLFMGLCYKKARFIFDFFECIFRTLIYIKKKFIFW